MSTLGRAEPTRAARLHISRRVAFVVATCSLVLVFAAAGTPIPLYNTYCAEDGITNADLGIVSVGYFVAAAVALLVFGRLSNYLGRRALALAALTSAAVSCLVLIDMHGVRSLLIGRVLQGLACGVASSGLGSYVVDTAPERPRWLPAAITGSAPMVGIPIGALACGALVQYGPAPRTLIYAVVAGVLAICAALIAMSPETMPRSPGALASLRPRLQIPAGCARLVLAAGASFVATWSLGGFYQAFGPSVAAEYLGTRSPLVAAAVFSSVMVLNPIGGPVSGRLRPATSLRCRSVVYEIAREVVVDSEAARVEAGDLIEPLSSGSLRDENIIHIADLAAGKRTIDVTRTTAFKSVGMALYDLYAARAFVAEATRLGRGTPLES